MTSRKPMLALAGAMIVAPLAAQTVAVRLAPGQQVQLGIYSYTPDRCIASGHTRIEIIAPPRLGRMAISNDVPFTIAQSNYAQCVGKPSVGTAAVYEAVGAGDDTATIAVIYPDGHRITASFRISVVGAPADAAGK